EFSAPAFLTLTTVAIAVAVIPAFTLAQQPGKDAAAAARQAIAVEKNSANDSDAPISRDKSVAIMVEFQGAPAATAYAEALRNAQAQVDAQRNYALAH